MADLPTSPNNREEQYLSSMAGLGTEVPPCPWSRKEAYLNAINGRIADLQEEIEEIENNPDVVDIVDTYADLQAYDTSTLTDRDIIRVLNDETHDGDSTYYRYSTATGEFTYIGTTKQYTDFVGTDGTTAGQAGLVPAPATTDAGKFLKADGTWDDAGTPINVVQNTGTSTTDVMSQNAVTEALAGAGGFVVRDISTADYNYPTTGTPTQLSVALLPPGTYTATEIMTLRCPDGTTWITLAGESFTVLSDNQVFYWGTTNYDRVLWGGSRQPSFILRCVDDLTSSTANSPLSANQGRILNNNIGNLTTLTTTAKTSTVAAINELVSAQTPLTDTEFNTLWENA